MRLAINGRFLYNRTTGVERVSLALLRELYALRGQDEIMVFIPGSDKPLPPEQWTTLQCHRPVCSRLNRHLWEHLTLAKLCRQYEADLLFCPANTGPYLRRFKMVLMVHCVSYYLFPETYSLSFRIFYNFLIPRLAKAARRVVTVSESSRHDMMRILELPPENIEVLTNGIDDIFFEPRQPEDRASLAKIGVPDDYLLTVSALSSRKNLKRILEGYFQAVAEAPQLVPPLVLVGAATGGLRRDPALARYVDEERLIFLGYRQDDELSRIYRNARLFLYPSLYDSFGLPPLEAMASGVPAVVSNSSCFPEIVGDGAIKVQPLNVTEIAQAILSGLQDSALRESLIKRGPEVARQYRWSTTAVKAWTLFRSLV